MNDEMEKLNQTVKSIERKATMVLLALFFIVALPYFQDSYVTFDLIYSTSLNDLSLRLNLGTIGFIPIIYWFAFLVLGYLLYTVYTVKKHKQSATTIKTTYKQFDIVSFIVYLSTIYIVINAFFFSFANVEGSSMEPTFYDGDNVIMQHRQDEYERFDLVVVKMDAITEQYLIKRVIGLPGDQVVIDEGEVYINDTKLDETLYIATDMETKCELNGTFCEFQLSDEMFFVLGDNRDDSYDSRHFGPIFKENIYGTVQFRIRPFSEFGSVE